MSLSEDYKKALGHAPAPFVGGHDPSLPEWVIILSEWRSWFVFWERRLLERRWANGSKEKFWSYRGRKFS